MKLMRSTRPLSYYIRRSSNLKTLCKLLQSVDIIACGFLLGMDIHSYLRSVVFLCFAVVSLWNSGADIMA